MKGKRSSAMVQLPNPNKKCRHDLSYDFTAKPNVRTSEEMENALKEAVKKHPFHDNADHVIDFHGTCVFRNGKGKVCGVLLPGALPKFAAEKAAGVLRHAASKTSLRSSMFGGMAPLSGIAGYFDYRGSPVELKCRKTSFTHENIKKWPDVFPMIDYVSAVYKATLPEHWALQDAAIPDVVRIHGSPFSTLTINQKFRTASHTDSGDFDDGYGVLAVLEGNYNGMYLGLDDYNVCFKMQPGDVLLFDTHLFHSNTEPEISDPADSWDRLSCVFYYRTALGEPHCVAEYNRRLKMAEASGSIPRPPYRTIKQKNNGENSNKPAPVFRIPLTPFIGASGACSLHGEASEKLLRLHTLCIKILKVTKLLFGEPLRTLDGPEPRSESDFAAIHPPASLPVSNLGGFSESQEIIKVAEQRHHSLNPQIIKEVVGEELAHIWSQSRAQWLKLVGDEWSRQVAKNPERTRFCWNNTSEMNTAFFDLCDVAKQIMIEILDNESPSKGEEQSFWVVFAAHLNYACIEELGMPHESMGMRKLNVKLKDYSFGGTRYLKDMPLEERQRRIGRRKHLEEARRRGALERKNNGGDWLQNDSFDYQTENITIKYEENGWPLPEENVKRLGLRVCGEPPVPTDSHAPISVLVVLPRPCTQLHAASTPPFDHPSERARIMCSPAAKRVLNDFPRNAPSEISSKTYGDVNITVAYDDDNIKAKVFDFVIMQHLLPSIPQDDIAAKRVAFWSSRARHCLFVVEADLMDRRQYVLKREVRTEYDRVAPSCLSTLYAAAYAIDSAKIRTTPALIALMERRHTIESRFKFAGSPMNTVAFVLRKKS
ncbi:putative DNA J-binding protein [Trypanosoma vivax]|nr:putative DNA J-binding protein [Trypanosoma vivax]